MAASAGKTFNLLRWLLGKSSRPEVFCKKGVLRDFAKFTEKAPVPSLF